MHVEALRCESEIIDWWRGVAHLAKGVMWGNERCTMCVVCRTRSAHMESLFAPAPQVYRSYIELGQYDVVQSEIGDSAPTALQAVKLLATYR